MPHAPAGPAVTSRSSPRGCARVLIAAMECSSSTAMNASAALEITGKATEDFSPHRKPDMIVLNGPATEVSAPARAEARNDAALFGSQIIVNGRRDPYFQQSQLTKAPASPPTPA